MKELIRVRVQYASRQQCCKTHKRPLPFTLDCTIIYILLITEHNRDVSPENYINALTTTLIPKNCDKLRQIPSGTGFNCVFCFSLQVSDGCAVFGEGSKVSFWLDYDALFCFITTFLLSSIFSNPLLFGLPDVILFCVNSSLRNLTFFRPCIIV